MNTTTNQITYKHIIIEENDVIFLGYKLVLTKTEYGILKELIESAGTPLSTEEISSKINIELSKENIRFHISSINKKAKIISNRKLIKNFAKNGYFLSEEM